MSRPQIICLTPVKNEAWILEKFLTCASQWADHIIIADQGSDDGSREIARRFPKVRLIENDSKTFNEPERQKLLLSAAREIPGPRLLFALDADEVITADFLESRDREIIERAEPGTVIKLTWACILPDRRNYYLYPTEFSFGFMDDGHSEHVGRVIHSPRLPAPENSIRISLRSTKVMHLAMVDLERFASKIRWYQSWEFLQGRWDRRLVPLYRWYHRDFCIPPDRITAIPAPWTAGYGRGDRLLDVDTQPFYRWDKAMLDLFADHGSQRFSRLAVWDVDWSTLHQRVSGQPPVRPWRDPRSVLERRIHRWLHHTQPFYSHFSCRPPLPTRIADRFICKLAAASGW